MGDRDSLINVDFREIEAKLVYQKDEALAVENYLEEYKKANKIIKLPVNYDRLNSVGRKQIRERYIEIQKGKCHYCGELLSSNPAEYVRSKSVNRKLFPKNFFDWPIHLHHDRNTGMTIGAVHNYCNAVLWQYHGE